MDAGFDLEGEILPVIRAKRRPGIRSWSYFVAAVHESREARALASIPIPNVVGDLREAQAGTRRARARPADPEEPRNPMLRAGAKYFRDGGPAPPDRSTRPTRGLASAMHVIDAMLDPSGDDEQ